MVARGAIDGRPDILVRLLAFIDTLELADGGAGCEVELPELGLEMSCFVGDFAGDYIESDTSSKHY